MKERIDVLITRLGYCESREKAKALIMSGLVYAGEERIDKAGTSVDESCKIEIRDSGCEFVSRGGKKLEKAMDCFGLSLGEKTCADIGASTGGFTDCMLKHGAKLVYAVDVGYGQLAWKLRNDSRVVTLERTNFRYITNKEIPMPLDFFSVDVSFISLKLILPAAAALCTDIAECICLIKPQFEAGRENVGKNGVVRDKAVHISVIENVFSYLRSVGFGVLGLTYSPIKGPKGNIEYLVHAKKNSNSTEIRTVDTVLEAHNVLKD
ncbi:MAG: TlyA family RNA methyltransferase [Oscillospiraceae bacterium]